MDTVVQKMKCKHNHHSNLRTVHICTTVVHNSAQSSCDCLPSQPSNIITQNHMQVMSTEKLMFL